MKSICMTISINYIIETAISKPEKLFGLVKKEGGGFLSPIQLYNLATESKKKGYIVLPMCNNVDDRGYCQGHEIEGEQ